MANEAGSKSQINRWGDTSGPVPGSSASYRDICTCFDQSRVASRRRVRFHNDRQDTSSSAWQHFLALIEEAAADGREVFRPLVDLSPQERRQIVTLPPTVAKLTAVKHFILYGSNLVRIPPEIGAMTSLQEFTPYTSYRLHWFPYELTRCPSLKRSTVSTRALYGNEKLRPPFPSLRSGRASTGAFGLGDVEPGEWGATSISACSVCDRSLEGIEIHQVWISLRVATDVLPLLVNACSEACVQALPTPPEDYVRTPHVGGPGITQPAGDYA
ncbi:leucine-rich repeat domain-containing protein [Streptomyces rubellomurinus]|uniref:leucine-rich repeat domain-containing protein n=1 Tax=Streptomyces rubellomurinus (strain ATCC 31215) TaxID=359131 RepID=UPI000A495AFA|nr:leucine-rich repeat domain-containing protein [Streptomyces rubellomurinus]